MAETARQRAERLRKTQSRGGSSSPNVFTPATSRVVGNTRLTVGGGQLGTSIGGTQSDAEIRANIAARKPGFVQGAPALTQSVRGQAASATSTPATALTNLQQQIAQRDKIKSDTGQSTIAANKLLEQEIAGGSFRTTGQTAGGTSTPNITTTQNQVATPVQRERPTVPTASNPVVPIERPSDFQPFEGRAFSQLDDREKNILIGFNQIKDAGGIGNLTDEQLLFKVSQQFPEVDTTAINAPLDAVNTQITGEEDRLASERKRLEAEREERLGVIGKDISAREQRSINQARESGDAVRQAAQEAMSFKGFGRSTSNAEGQADIQKDTELRIESIQAASEAERQYEEARLRGADEQVLSAIQENIDSLRQTAIEAEINRDIKLQELNAQNQVTGQEAIENFKNLYASTGQAGFDEDLTKLINDGYLYSVGANGLPERVRGADGTEIKTGVNDSDKSNIKVSLPSQNDFGESIPGYAYDSDTGEMTILNPDGSSQLLSSDGSGASAISKFKSFDEYAQNTGTGNIISDSPYHKSFEIDIDGEIGDLVSAFTSGTVVEVDSKGAGGFGKNIVIDDGAGNLVRYAHLNGVNVAKGQFVPSGSFIGEIGNTGSVIPLNGGDGSHLHIEARDASGDTVPLSSLAGVPQNNYQLKNTSQLRALAVRNGYITKDQQLAFINAAKQGVQLPNLAQVDVDERVFGQANTLRDEFNTISKDYIKVRDAYGRIIESAKDPSAAGDLALIFNYMKMLDPGSTVREGEFATAQNAGGVGDRVISLYNNIQEGERLSGGQRDDFVDRSNRLYKSQAGLQQKNIDRYSELSDLAGISPAMVIEPIEEFGLNLSSLGEVDRYSLERASLANGEILIKRISDGQIGSVPEGEFDPNIYERL